MTILPTSAEKVRPQEGPALLDGDRENADILKSLSGMAEPPKAESLISSGWFMCIAGLLTATSPLQFVQGMFPGIGCAGHVRSWPIMVIMSILHII